MDSQKGVRINRLTAILVFMIGSFLTIIPQVFNDKKVDSDWEIAFVSIGTSIAAAGVVLIVQIYFLGDQGSRVEMLLQDVLARKLPAGVSRLFLRLDDAPRIDELLRSCKKVSFFGPGGALILSNVADEARKRKRSERVILQMYLPANLEEVADNVARPDFKTSPEWDEAHNKAKQVEAQGTLQLEIYRVKMGPTISALQIDESYYQVTMLFPVVANQKRPTLALDGIVAKEEYFEPLWNTLRSQIVKI